MDSESQLWGNYESDKNFYDAEIAVKARKKMIDKAKGIMSLLQGGIKQE